MNQFVKDALYTGVGFVALSAEKAQEKVESLMNDWDSRTAEYREEGRKVLDKLAENAEDFRDDFFKNLGAKRKSFSKEVNQKVDEFERKAKKATEKVIDVLEVETTADIAEETKTVAQNAKTKVKAAVN